MDEEQAKPRFHWTAQIDRQARLLAALGTAHAAIALTLGCDRATVRKHLGKQGELPRLSLSEMADLFERYDAERNIAEAMMVRSGSPEQARLRSSFRVRMASQMRQSEGASAYPAEELSDEQLCAEVERLVGRPIKIRDGT